MRPSKKLVRQAIQKNGQWMGTDRERHAQIGMPTYLQDAKIWHALSRADGVTEEWAAECEAWAILYRAAFAGRNHG